MTEPGEVCEGCARRVPFPKKENSPQSKTFSYRIPLDDADTHRAVAEAAAHELGILGEKYWQWKLAAYEHALVLTGHRLSEEGG